jgi:hypothetical protein
MGISRRTILKYGLGGASVLALGGVGLSMRQTRMFVPQVPLQVLSEREYSILSSVAETILPGTQGYPSARDVQIAERVDAALFACDDGVQSEFKQLLALLESAVAGFVLAGRSAPFSTLSYDERWKVLDSWRSARVRLFRTAFKAIHGLVTASYYSAPQVHDRIGYPGVPAWVTAVRVAGLKEAAPSSSPATPSAENSP